jgi:hypothetical protein
MYGKDETLGPYHQEPLSEQWIYRHLTSLQSSQLRLAGMKLRLTNDLLNISLPHPSPGVAL